MKKIILIASCLVLLASCSLTNPTNRDVPTDITPSSGSVSTSSTTFTQDIESTSDKIKSTGEFQDCMKQQTNMCIQSAGMQIAQKTKDASFCKELPTTEQQSSCEFAIVIMSAQEKNDEKICDTLKNPSYLTQCKVQVYRQAAITENNVNLCDKIGNILKSQEGTIGGSESDMQKDQCVMQYITSSPNSKESDCNKISDQSSLDMCKMMLKNKPKDSSSQN